MKNYNVLTLAEALQQWCDPLLLLQVMEWEPKCTASEVDSLRRIHLTHRAFRRDATQTNVAGNPHMRLRAAWSDLEQDLCRRIEQGLIHLRGVRIAPDKRTDPEIIPGVWAAAFKFDFGRGMITIGDLRFAAVACSFDPWTPEATQASATAQLPAAAPIAKALAQLRPEDFPELSDELVLELLEEHARRVIKNGGKLIAAGKVSWLPIVRGKMQHRAETGTMYDSLAAEADWLSKWMSGKVKLHQVPTAGTINKHLGNDYKQLQKARSTPAIQKA